MFSPFSCVWLCVTPWLVAHQASLSMGFSRLEYWSGLPFPPPQDLKWGKISNVLKGKYFTKCNLGASLVVQWLRIRLVMQGTPIWSLGWEDPLEKGMATHSSVLAWRIPGTGEPGGLPSMGSHRVGHDWSDLAAAAAAAWKIPRTVEELGLCTTSTELTLCNYWSPWA